MNTSNVKTKNDLYNFLREKGIPEEDFDKFWKFCGNGEMHLIIDNSASTTIPISDEYIKETRYVRMNEIAHFIMRLMLIIDTSGVDVLFLNDASILTKTKNSFVINSVKHIDTLDILFKKNKPCGSTPLVEALDYMVNNITDYEKNHYITMIIDGLTDTQHNIDPIKLIKSSIDKHLNDHEQLYITIVLITDDNDVINKYFNMYNDPKKRFYVVALREVELQRMQKNSSFFRSDKKLSLGAYYANIVLGAYNKKNDASNNINSKTSWLNAFVCIATISVGIICYLFYNFPNHVCTNATNDTFDIESIFCDKSIAENIRYAFAFLSIAVLTYTSYNIIKKIFTILMLVTITCIICAIINTLCFGFQSSVELIYHLIKLIR